MGRCYLHLSLEERREFKCNSVRFDDQPELNGYHALCAQDKYDDRRAIHRRLIRFPEVMVA